MFLFSFIISFFSFLFFPFPFIIFHPFFAFLYLLLRFSLIFTFFYFYPFLISISSSFIPKCKNQAILNIIVRATYQRISFSLNFHGLPTTSFHTWFISSILRTFVLFFPYIHTPLFTSCVATSPSKYLISLSLLNENQT